MSFNPATIVALAAFYKTQGGLNAGIVGSTTTHCGGYHLGSDRIFANGTTACACVKDGVCRAGLGTEDYSVQTARDKAGLSKAAAAIDLGSIHGTLPPLRKLTAFLVAQCRADAPDARDVRELIGSLDGSAMFEWLRERDGSGPGVPFTKDPSHRTHTHVSYYRDSETRDKTPLIRRFFEGGEHVKNITDLAPMLVDVAAGTPQFALDGVTPAGTSVARTGSLSPFGCDTQRAVYLSVTTGVRTLVLLTPSAVNPLPTPATTSASASSATTAVASSADLAKAVLEARQAQYDLDQANISADLANPRP